MASSKNIIVEAEFPIPNCFVLFLELFIESTWARQCQTALLKNIGEHRRASKLVGRRGTLLSRCNFLTTRSSLPPGKTHCFLIIFPMMVYWVALCRIISLQCLNQRISGLLALAQIMSMFVQGLQPPSQTMSIPYLALKVSKVVPDGPLCERRI